MWRQFNEVHADLWQYLEQTTERLIKETISADRRTVKEPVGLL